MASLKTMAQQVLEEARDGIAWIALYKEGRGWGAACFWPDIDKNNEFIFEPEDIQEIKSILATDPEAIFVNGYYTNLGPMEEMTRESLTAALRWQYEEHFNQLADAAETALRATSGNRPTRPDDGVATEGAAAMRITHLTITQNGQYIGKTSIREQAVNAAKTRAAETGKPVSVVARLEDGRDREVIFNPDGTNERIWDIDKGQRLEPVVGQVYTNRGGGEYLCLARKEGGRTVYFNASGGSSDAAGVFQNIKSGWTFTAKGLIQYIDGTIEWDHSVGGTFKELAAH